MNQYFTPKTPKPKLGAVDIVLRALMGVIAVTVVVVGLWMAIDTLNSRSAPPKPTAPSANEMVQTNLVQQIANAPR